MNRKVTAVIAHIHFAPAKTSKDNLLKKVIQEDTIYATENTAIGALKTTVKEDYSNEIVESIYSDSVILPTAYRRENLVDTMDSMFSPINRVVEEFENVHVIYPIRMNPLASSSANEIF